MRKVLAVSAVLYLLSAPLIEEAGSPRLYAAAVASAQDESSYVPYSPEQLDNLLAPIALYPDPLLAQVLPAATFVDQIDEAARYVRAHNPSGIDDQPWDVSVKAVAHYPGVLYMMADKLDWTTAVGQAYVNQSTDMMVSVQRLRAMANAQGNLVSTPQQQVIVEPGYFAIWPANPQYLYVPVYDPTVIYFQSAYFGGGYGDFFAFSDGFIIGAWLNRDCDWPRHRVFYTGWQGSGWVEHSRRFVQINNVYVNPRFANIAVNRTITNRPVSVTNINRFNSVHPNLTYNNVVRNPIAENPNNRVNNRVINRNVNTNDPRLDQYRGRENYPRAAPPSARTDPRPSTRPALPPASRPQYQPPPRAFGRPEGGFDPRISSQRGQSSRGQAAQPVVPSRPSDPPGRRP
jgi:hypothetical protein